jgi:SET domain
MIMKSGVVKTKKVGPSRSRKGGRHLLVLFFVVVLLAANRTAEFVGFCCGITVIASAAAATAVAADPPNSRIQDDDHHDHADTITGDNDDTCDDDPAAAVVTSTSASDDATPDDNDEYDDDDEYDDGCTLYLAASTIPGAGLGIFTAVERHAGETIGAPGGDVCIPVVDSWWNNMAKSTTGSTSTSNNTTTSSDNDKDDDTDESYYAHVHNPFPDFFWQGQGMGMLSEAASGDVDAFCPGLDCAVNCHLGLVNVMKSIPENDAGMGLTNKNDNGERMRTMIHRATHATAGSFTPYYNGTTVVSRRIPSGGELFKYYGDSWFTSRQETFGYIPLSEDYEDAELILHKFVNVTTTTSIEKSKRKSKATTPDATANNTTKNHYTINSSFSLLQQDLYELILSIRDRQETSRILNALPDTLHDALWAAAEQDMSVFLQEQHTRSVEWLRRHGRCLDHVQGKTSTMRSAGGASVGRGAFARRWIRKGQVITTSPLHHLPHGVVRSSRRNDDDDGKKKHGHYYYNHSFVSMYNITARQQTATEADDDSDESSAAPTFIRILDRGVRQQLMVNYCYGHRDTTMLLCPYGTGVHYLNHAPSSSSPVAGNDDDDNDNANTEIVTANVAMRWARNFPIAHNHDLLYNLSLEQLEQPEYSKPLFSIDFVALRDMEPGEELFLNYGVDWQEAWDAHVQEWDASIETKLQEYRHYHPAAYWNQFFGDGDVDSVLRTTDEQQVDPYPSNIDLRCHFHLAKGTSQTNYTWRSNEMGFPCQILDRFVENNTIWYTADVEVRSTNLNGVPTIDDDDDDLDIQKGDTSSSSSASKLSSGSTTARSRSSSLKTRVTRVLRTDLPRRAFRFFDKPGTTDIHLPGAFRHWIGIPDEMVPPQWKNLS